MQNKYKIGITSYDDWNLLWETKLGFNDKKQTLLFSVWGKSQSESKINADNLKILLEKLG